MMAWRMWACGLNYLVDYFMSKTPDLWGKCDNKEEYLHRAEPFARVLRYKRGSDIIEGDIMEVRVYRCLFGIKHQMTFTYFSLE
jgi:hypothetical protein